MNLSERGWCSLNKPAISQVPLWSWPIIYAREALVLSLRFFCELTTIREPS